MFTPGAHGERARFLRVVRDEVAVRVGAIVQLADRVVVGDDEAVEAPFAAQHVAQQPAVGVRRHAVDFVVRRHDADRARLVDRRLERCERNVSRSTRIETFTGAQFVPDSGWPCAAKCFSVAMHARLSANVASPWKPRTAATPIRATRYGSSPKVSSTRPQRGIARDVDHGRQRLVRAAGARLRGRHRVERSTRSGSNVAARPIGCGKLVPSTAA